MNKQKYVMELKTSSKELSLVSCGYEECGPTHSYGPVVRKYHTLHFVLSGCGHYYVNDKHYIIHENQCFLINPNVLTLYHADSSNPWTYVWICFSGDTVPPILEHCNLNSSKLICYLSDLGPIRELILDMMNYPSLTPSNELYIQSNLYRIFAKLEEQTGASFSDIESVNDFYISRAIDYIQHNTYENLTVQNIALYLNISRSYLFSLFKRHLNVSPQQFITNVKLTNARELLTKTEISIATVALSCGYTNPFAFSRAFKKEVGLTPSEYRKIYYQPDELLNC
ncbi:AraC family transcriptional regulator [Clostridium estertheticum]|uniref:AraC family transcriptional regulator n=1 Tax=Clostridium estertheticum TaxID=238834 RepID=UPI001CF4EE52|nr:AraC family transcriptional regulator [Clostridium estertheticum]MCB2360817.1 AraC family transcriptional regulator [Clostridium estertheticum]